jgi:hypothetical protein
MTLIAYNKDRRRTMECDKCGKALTRKPGWGGLKWATAVIRFSNKHSNCGAKA